MTEIVPAASFAVYALPSGLDVAAASALPPGLGPPGAHAARSTAAAQMSSAHRRARALPFRVACIVIARPPSLPAHFLLPRSTYDAGATWNRMLIGTGAPRGRITRTCATHSPSIESSAYVR